MADFGLVESFGIDGGELDGCSKQECFVLGYEFLQVCHQMNVFDIGNGHLVHSANVSRLQSAADGRNKVLTVQYLADDRSESWCLISWKHKK